MLKSPCLNIYTFLTPTAQEKLKALVWKSKAFQENSVEMESLWKSCSQLLFSLEDRQKQLGLGQDVRLCISKWFSCTRINVFKSIRNKWHQFRADVACWSMHIPMRPQYDYVYCLCMSKWPLLYPQGITTYFSGNCCLEDAKLAQKFLDSQVHPSAICLQRGGS